MSVPNSATFLAAFVRVEKHLRKMVDGRRDESFGALVTRAASSNPLIRRFADDLREYADLRNAIVHERRGAEAIAEPHSETVAELERIAGIIADPPRVNQLGSKVVETCTPKTPVGESARQMLASSFSQMPVYDDREFFGLLTAGTIARWLGAELGRLGGVLEEQTVSEVLRFREATSVEEFIRRDRPIVEVLDLFDAAARSGKHLEAVLVTQNGGRRERPLNILTVFDLPRLHELTL
jgi:CBS domain-containing protein